MGLFDGKKGLVLGVANDRSIAWVIAREIMEQGGLCGFTHLPDRADDEKRRNRRRVAQCVDGYPQAKFLVPLNVVRIWGLHIETRFVFFDRWKTRAPHGGKTETYVLDRTGYGHIMDPAASKRAAVARSDAGEKCIDHVNSNEKGHFHGQEGNSFACRAHGDT